VASEGATVGGFSFLTTGVLSPAASLDENASLTILIPLSMASRLKIKRPKIKIAKISQISIAKGADVLALLPEAFCPFALLAEEDEVLATFLVLVPLRVATL